MSRDSHAAEQRVRSDESSVTALERRELLAGIGPSSALVGPQSSPGTDSSVPPGRETRTALENVPSVADKSTDTDRDVHGGQAVVYLEGDTAYAMDGNDVLDSGTDHSRVLQTALDGRGEVFIKQGTYAVNLTIPRHTVVRGSGRSTESGTDVARLVPDDPSTPVLQRHSTAHQEGCNTILESLVLDGQNGSTDLIAVTGLFNLFVVDCVLMGTTGRGIDCNKLWDSWLVRCKFKNTGSANRELPQIHLRNDVDTENPTNGIRIVHCAGPSNWQYVLAEDRSKHNWIHNNRFETYGNGPYAVELTAGCDRNFLTNNYVFGGRSAAVKMGGRGVVANNDLTGGIPGDEDVATIPGHGLELVDGDHVVSINQIKGNAGHGITGNANRSVIVGNNVRGGGSSADGIALAGDGSEYFAVSGNVVRRFLGRGVVVNGSGGCRGGLIQGNAVVNNNRDGGTSSGVVIDGIDGTSVASNVVGDVNGGTGVEIAGDADTFVVANRVAGGIDVRESANATVKANDAEVLSGE
jgi:hypothetical protein